MAAPRGPCGLCCGPAARCLPSHGRPVAAVRGPLPALGGGCGRQGPLPELREPAAMREVRLEQAAKPCGLAVRSRRMSAVGGEGDRRWCCSFPRAPFQPGGGFSALLEAGSGVNAPADAFGQSPAHLAAGGGEACFLLWQLQTGADLNQQDCLGEAPIHKAAKAGSLECLALLVAGDAKIDLCNNSGQTAADLALACGFLECAKFLKTIQHTQTMKLRGQSSSSLNGNHSTLSEDLAAQEQEWEVSRSTSRKRRRSDGV
uniref:Ankyrin repeat domain 37 n=1 Tax=Anas zonorhyncha TaxID=75864 RepID=A0A8B9ZP26_9AVES